MNQDKDIALTSGPQTATLRLKRGKNDSLERFHPWVFSGAVSHVPPTVREGDLVRVVADDGRVMGTGHYQPGSIAVRMLTFGNAGVDNDYYARRLARALQMRRALGLDNGRNNTYRLVHGEGDFLPGLVVDIYADTAVVQAHSAGMHYARHAIADALVSLPGLNIGSVYYKSEGTLPFKAGLDARDGYLLGHSGENVSTENGLQFNIDWLRGQKTGFFIDQRDNRALLAQYARDRRVLNMFCYTGGFSVYALAGGARTVHSVDSSAKAIALTDANVALNFGEDTACRHTSFAEDAFKFIDAMADGAYDLIVLDPPAFAKHRGAIPNALRGYQKLNARAMQKAAPGTVMFTFSCSQAVSREQFRLAVFSAAAQTGRRVRILHQLTQPADHPVNIYHPEGEYLKGLVLYIE